MATRNDVERRTEHGRRQEDRDILALVGDLERALHAFKSPIIVREGIGHSLTRSCVPGLHDPT